MWLAWENATLGYPGGPAVLEHVSCRVGPGLWLVTGSNGSGKSCLLRSAAGIIRPRSGSLQVDGADAWANPPAYRWLVGYAPQDVEDLPDLNALHYLAYLAALKGVRAPHQQARCLDLLHQFGLPDSSLAAYSAGMKRRLAIAAALLGDPDILVLDEPTACLDPEEKVALRTRLTALSADRIVLAATCVPEDLAGAASGRVHLKNKEVLCNGDSD